MSDPSITFDLRRIDFYDGLLNESNWRSCVTRSFTTRTRFVCSIPVPGVGKILALVLLYEIHDISRFPSVQDFVSYCRLVKPKEIRLSSPLNAFSRGTGLADLCARESIAFVLGHALYMKAIHGGKAWKRRCSSSATIRRDRGTWPAWKKKTHSKGKALTILAHKLARAVYYYMLRRNEAFDMKRFLNHRLELWSGAGEPYGLTGPRRTQSSAGLTLELWHRPRSSS